MNLEKHTIEEKFEMLSFLQRNLKIGSFVVTRLKTKDTYQISFVNGSSLKVRNEDLNICLDNVIVDVAEYYHDTYQTDFYTDFLIKAEREFQEMQTKKIRELNSTIQEMQDKINELEHNHSIAVMKGFYNGDTDTYIPDDKRGFINPEKEVQRIMGVFDDVIEDLKKDYNGGSKLFSEYDLYKEIIRRYDEYNTVDDVISIKKHSPDMFKKLRARAYDRLYKRKKNNGWK